jgi:hypothetical protein
MKTMRSKKTKNKTKITTTPTQSLKPRIQTLRIERQKSRPMKKTSRHLDRQPFSVAEERISAVLVLSLRRARREATVVGLGGRSVAELFSPSISYVWHAQHQ